MMMWQYISKECRSNSLIMIMPCILIRYFEITVASVHDNFGREKIFMFYVLYKYR
jgi:hypothetical protein